MSARRLGCLVFIGLALLGACVAPEQKEPARRPQAAVPNAGSNRTDLEAAPIPNRRVTGPSSSIIQSDTLKR
ncbi:MAG: hypothetical protein NVSMB18_20630 [Acetobacteraceae bacterium]